MSEDGNQQDMLVEDKEHAALGATEEAQDVSRLNRIVVPMPAFTNPNNPATSGGSINLELDEHPVEHDPDFGVVGLRVEGLDRDPVTSVADAHSRGMSDDADEPGGPGRKEAAKRTPQVEYPENREDWQKKHWQAKARELGVAVSGAVDDVKERVETAETVEEEYAAYKAGDWQSDIEDAETADDLAELRAAYDRSGAQFSTVASAFDKRAAELNDES